MSAFPRWLKVTLILAAILMLAGLAWYYRAQRQRRLQEVNTNLETIMQPKLNWIDLWRTNRENQAALVMANRLYVSSAMRWMKIPPKSEEIKTETPQGGIETILLVEDEASVLKLTKLMLERMGYTVIAASAPSEARIHIDRIICARKGMSGGGLSARIFNLEFRIYLLPETGVFPLGGRTHTSHLPMCLTP